jgi:GNAT superfamily N-acetyltransferase
VLARTPTPRATTSSPRALVRRAIEFERDCLAVAAGHVEPHALGRWLRNPDMPGMWAMNQLYVEGPQPDLTAETLCAELDRGLADAHHRRAIVTDDATGRRIADGMRAAGYGAGPLAVMLLDREPPVVPESLAREIDEPAMRALEERIVAHDDEIPPHDKQIVIEGHAHMRATIPGTRMFAGVDGGEDVCRTFLYTDGRTGQPEDVETLPAHRGKGLAAATVSLAAREALAAGCDLVFILANAANGPVALYSELGFRVSGRFWTFNRQLP